MKKSKKENQLDAVILFLQAISKMMKVFRKIEETKVTSEKRVRPNLIPKLPDATPDQ